MTNPVSYQVRDLNNEKILGSFYTRELSPAKQNIFRIEKVINRKNKMALVKWVGYTDTDILFNAISQRPMSIYTYNQHNRCVG